MDASPLLTHVISFDLAVPYPEWRERFDAHAPVRERYGIQTLFCGKGVHDGVKICVILQAEPGVVDRFLQEEDAYLRDAGHLVESNIVQVVYS